jgi:hypothetical protein
VAAAAHAGPAPAGWLRDRTFDLNFIAGVAVVALLSGALVASDPRWFAPLLILDLWLLGYHHVISTFTRLCFDRQSFRERRRLVLALPFAVCAGVTTLYVAVGPWSLATLYLYWQWFHYTRQSYGIEQVYRRKAPDTAPGDPRVDRLALYLLPLWGILHRSAQAPATFLGVELRALPVPALAVDIVGAAALLALLGWAAPRARAALQGQLPAAHTLYMSSHFAIFFVGYVLIENIDHGWLVLNVWHNLQYILFVWLFNARRFEGGVDPGARLLSTLSQPRNARFYFATCLAISTSVYLLIDQAVGSLALVLVVYQTINFHHYVVDGLIWKVRRRRLQQTLGLETAQ